MKLARFNGVRLGLVVGDAIIDVSDLAPVPVDIWPPIADVALIAKFAGLRPQLEEAMATRLPEPLSSIHLEAPITWPSKNSADKNGFFLKASSSLSGPNNPIVLPEIAGRAVHHECELAIVVGQGGRHIRRDDALQHIFGYSCLIDMTVRGQEERVMRKSFDTFCPLGPWIVTADEVADPDELEMQLTVNGEIRQMANTRDLIVDIRDMIVLASSVVTLYPGDIIATGTPEGVGPLHDGDEVTITIAKIGSMTLPVIQGRGGSNIAFDHNNSVQSAGAEDLTKSEPQLDNSMWSRVASRRRE
jgi:hypothetical protein